MPKLNPSRGPMPSTTPQRPQMQEMMPEPEAEPEAPKSLWGRVKDKAIGVAKSFGTDVINNAELAVKEGPRAVAGAINPLGRFLPQGDKIPGVRTALDKAKGVMEPSSEEQRQYKEGTQLATLLIPFVGAPIAKSGRMARYLEETSLKLTAAEKRDLGDKLNRVTNFLVEKGITGNPSERVEKTTDLYRQTERRLQRYFNEIDDQVKIPRDLFVTELENLKTKMATNHRMKTAIEAQFDDLISEFKNNYAKTPFISVKDFNEWKRSVMDNAFNKAGLKVSDDVEFAAGGAAKDFIETYTKGLKIDGRDISEFNKEYASLIEARKLLIKAEDRDEIGMVGKILTTMLGAGLGGSVGFAAGGPAVASITGPAGFYAGQKIAPVVAGTNVRSNIGQLYEAISVLEPAAKKALLTLLLAPGRAADSLSPDAEPAASPEASAPEASVPPPQIEKAPLDSFKID